MKEKNLQSTYGQLMDAIGEGEQSPKAIKRLLVDCMATLVCFHKHGHGDHARLSADVQKLAALFSFFDDIE